MKFTIRRDYLLNALNQVNKAVSSKTPIPPLTGILFDVNENGLTLIGSDSDITIKTFIATSREDEEIITVEENGSVILQSKFITEIIRKIPNQFINFEIIDGALTKISTETSEFNLNGMDASEYPNLELEVTENPIRFETDVFKGFVNQTVFAISALETRPILTGVNFKLLANGLEIVATDSYRLASKKIQLTSFSNRNVNIVIPGKSLIELSRILLPDVPELEMHVFGNKVLFKNGDLILQSRLLEGTYPDTSRLIPTEFEFEFNVSTQLIYNAIDRASLLSRDRTKNVVKMMIKGNNVVEIISNSPEIGKVHEEVEVELLNGNELVISFNARYVMEALKYLNCEVVKFSFNGDMKPFIIQNVYDDSTLQLVLPVRTY
jgi:DNA polymerase-3 subunit beta